MFGYTIIKVKELDKLRNLCEVRKLAMQQKNDTIRSLEAQVKKLTRKRNAKGQYTK